METVVLFLIALVFAVAVIKFVFEFVLPIAIFVCLFYCIGGFDYTKELIAYLKGRFNK